MKNKMNKKTIGLVAAALMLVATIGVGSALAYFTTFSVANGGKTLELNFTKSNIDEEIDFDKKIIQIENIGDTATYVRIKPLSGDKHPVAMESEETRGSWKVADDGYYYYKDILQPGDTTSSITFSFSLEGNESFNVIIVQESTPVLYKADGTPYADWSVKAEISESYDVAPLE